MKYLKILSIYFFIILDIIEVVAIFWLFSKISPFFELTFTNVLLFCLSKEIYLIIISLQKPNKNKFEEGEK